MRYLWILLAIFCSPVAAVAERSPNIVLIFADDLGWGDVGFNGRKEWRTPNLDRLAKQGTLFRRWYTAGVVCAPSRAALLTGKYTIHCGVSGNNDDLPRKEVTLAEALKERGYATGLFGKWHHGATRPCESSYVHPMDQGFEEFIGFTSATDAWQHFPKELWFGRTKKPVQGYADTLFTNFALDFMQRNASRPFFLYLPYTAPHFYIQAPPEDIAEHRGKFNEKDPNRPLNATYAAMITRLDKEVGRVLKRLDNLRIAKDTIVIFTSDHGATFELGSQGTSAYHDSNRPFRGGKRTLWEGGIRVPGAVRWPSKIPAGKVSDQIVLMIDLFPTLLAAAGGAPSSFWRVDGLNLLPVWMGKAEVERRTLFWEWRSEGYHQIAAMRDNLKLVVTGQTPPVMYNVKTDPGERINVIAENEWLARWLLRDLRAWLKTETVESRWGKPEQVRGFWSGDFGTTLPPKRRLHRLYTPPR